MGVLARTPAFVSVSEPTPVTQERKEMKCKSRAGFAKVISNAKTWLLGTHHGIHEKYLDRYMAEYSYRFNRRHDPDSLFHRALFACAIAKPKTLRTLSG